MPEKKLNGMRVAILVTDDFEQVELTEPKKALEQAGATTMIMSPNPGQVQGMNHDVRYPRINDGGLLLASTATHNSLLNCALASTTATSGSPKTPLGRLLDAPFLPRLAEQEAL